MGAQGFLVQASRQTARAIDQAVKRSYRAALFFATMMFPMSNDDFQVVYDILSFSLACMMSCTLFPWMRVPSVTERYKTPLLISGLVTFIAAYHYIRIFNSWVEAYHYPAAKEGIPQQPEITGIHFNDAYRYMDWRLTVPLLLMEIVLTMSLPPEESSSKCR